jgi:hypothetical protein
MKSPIDFRAVLVGSLAGWGLSYLLSLTTSVTLARYYVTTGMPLDEVARHMGESLTATLAFLSLSLIASAFGGWSSANVAGHDRMKHGLATGLFYMATGLIGYLSPFPNNLPLWQAFVTLLLSVPVAMLGSTLTPERGTYPH